MTDLIERMKEALLSAEGLVLDHYFNAMHFLGSDARTLLPEAIKEIEDLRSRAEAAEAKANVMVADKINLRSELLSVEAKLAKAVEVLERIASGGLSGYVLTSNPPQDPAVVAAQSALAEIIENP